MHLFCDKHITFYLDNSYMRLLNSECETFTMTKLLFYLYTHVRVDISPYGWFCAFDYPSET